MIIILLNELINKIVNISTLSNLTSLEYLDLSNNKIVDISALSSCYPIIRLDLINNKLSEHSDNLEIVTSKILIIL